MRRIVPYPLLAVALLAMWLLLTQTFSAAQFLLGSVIAVGVTHATVKLRPRRAKLGVQSLGAIARLLGLVIMDMVRSNIAVGAIVLGHRANRVSNFVRFPLELRDPFGLTAMALILTAIPGTVWVEYNAARGELIVHVLDLVDEEAWIAMIKNRYEKLLLEIFGS